MSNKIIDDIDKLVKMSREELDKVLLDTKYNKANLRELIRRLVKDVKLYRSLFLADYIGIIPQELSTFIMSIEAMDGVKDCYLHRNWYDGSIELNIEFNDNVREILGEVEKNEDIKSINSCAFWE